MSNDTTQHTPADVRERAETMRAMLMVSECLSRNVAAMQAAWIEWQHGRGADAAMQWIENSLSGPGLVPGMDEVDAQAFFDAALAEMSDHRKAVEDEIAALLRTPSGERPVIHIPDDAEYRDDGSVHWRVRLPAGAASGEGEAELDEPAREVSETRWWASEAVRAARRGEGGGE